MTARTATTSSDFAIQVSDHGLGYNPPQKAGRKLWAPMWLMAIMAFPVAFIVGLGRAGTIADGGSDASILSLLHTQAGIMFIGFAAVFAAISFAIARILGEFRKGGGEIQELVGQKVITLKMPGTVKVFLLGMMMSMVAILVASVIHFVWAAQLSGGSVTVADAESAFIALEAVRRLGVAVYLVAITFGLATITRVLRFQAIRIRELAGITS